VHVLPAVWIYSVICKSLWDFRPLWYNSRDGHTEGEHVNRGRDTPSFWPTLQLLDTPTLLCLSWLLRSQLRMFRRDLRITLYICNNFSNVIYKISSWWEKYTITFCFTESVTIIQHSTTACLHELLAQQYMCMICNKRQVCWLPLFSCSWLCMLTNIIMTALSSSLTRSLIFKICLPANIVLILKEFKHHETYF
jgi:hypothetical protein